jgi:hypothetical protein
MHRHHIIPRFEWVMRNGGENKWGYNDPSNIEYVTPQEHAERHRARYKLYGFWQDLQAAQLLERMSRFESKIAKVSSVVNLGKQRALGTKRTPEQRAARSEGQRGKVRGPYKGNTKYCSYYLRKLKGRLEA